MACHWRSSAPPVPSAMSTVILAIILIFFLVMNMPSIASVVANATTPYPERGMPDAYDGNTATNGTLETWWGGTTSCLPPTMQ
jgi:hypothetical protein